MITPQLIDFIKQQLQSGLTKEKISGDLLANGWTEQDIEEGFKASINIPIPPNLSTTPSSSVINNNVNAFSTPSVTEKHLGKKIFFIVLIFLLLAGGASAYYYRDDLINLPIVKSIIGNRTVPVVQNIPATSEVSQTPLSPASPIDCPDDNINCFITAATNCFPATLEWNMTENISGTSPQTIKSKLELGGLDSSGKCTFSELIEDASVNFTPEMKTQAKNSGMTDASIVQMEALENKLIKSTIGTTLKCSYATDKLVQILTNWSEGKFSVEDSNSSDCTAKATNGNSVQLYTKPIATTPKNVAPSLDISNWKTYKNTEYGFQFKYPSSEPDPTVRVINPLIQGQDQVVSISTGSYILSISGYYSTTLKRDMTMDEILNSYMKPFTTENITINNIKAVRVSRDDKVTSIHTVDVYIPLSATKFITASYFWNLNSSNPTNQSLYESMVASFKFIPKS
jgi:hypothetical protein